MNALERLPHVEELHAEGADAVNDRPLRYGLGFELADPLGTFGPEPVAFGHSGAGGGRHGAWPERGIGFSFLPGELRSEDADDRASTLLTALHGCLLSQARSAAARTPARRRCAAARPRSGPAR